MSVVKDVEPRWSAWRKPVLAAARQSRVYHISLAHGDPVSLRSRDELLAGCRGSNTW
jgi:hypothetical protein